MYAGNDTSHLHCHTIGFDVVQLLVSATSGLLGDVSVPHCVDQLKCESYVMSNK